MTHSDGERGTKPLGLIGLGAAVDDRHCGNTPAHRSVSDRTRSLWCNRRHGRTDDKREAVDRIRRRVEIFALWLDELENAVERGDVIREQEAA